MLADGEVVGVATRDVFSEQELARLRGFPEITRAELIRYLTLISAEEEFLGKFLGLRNVLGAGVQLCVLPSLGWAGRPHPGFVGAARAASPVPGQCGPQVDCPSTEMSYDLRRLRAHGLITRVPHSHRYRLTDTGLHHAMLLSHLHTRLLLPGLAHLTDPDPPEPSILRTAARNYQRALDQLTHEARLAA